MSLLEIIKPIKLLSGAHADTGTTGQGCFMNVIAYLNGEPQITDRSPCVCLTIRPIAVRFNDFLKDDERELMMPYIERAMGSTTNDINEMSRRAWLAADLANKCSVIAAAAGRWAADSEKFRDQIKQAYIEFMDAALPAANQLPEAAIRRAEKLAALAA
jgi:hypothetical protein